MGGCPGSKENKLYTSYPQKMWTTFVENQAVDSWIWDEQRMKESYPQFYPQNSIISG